MKYIVALVFGLNCLAGIGHAQHWSPGSAHKDHPNVIAATEMDHWLPANGYTWVVSPPNGDLRVKWAPGMAHRDHPNVVAADSPGWLPAPGYAWVNNEPNDLRVKWSPGMPHLVFPNVIAHANERSFIPADGHQWGNLPEELRSKVLGCCSKAQLHALAIEDTALGLNQA